MTILAWDLPTPLGVFPAGLPITVLARQTLRVKLCLDPPGVHLSGRCHSMFVSTDSIREDDRGTYTSGKHAPIPAGLAAASPEPEGGRWLAL